MNRLLIWAKGVIENQQCHHATKPEDYDEEGRVTSFCVRYKGHFGKHEKRIRFKCEWLDFKQLRKCSECDWIQGPYFRDHFARECCPKCGNIKIEKVVGRWYVESDYGRFPNAPKAVRCEIVKTEGRHI